MNRIYYIGFYGDNKAYKENRYIHPAGVNKMDYIAKAIGETGLNVRIISPAWLNYKNEVKSKISGIRKFTVTENVDCVLPFSVAFPGKIATGISMLLSKIWFVLYVLFKINKNDNVLAYNSPFYFKSLYWLRKIKKFHLILEVEEVYSEVFSMSQKWKRREQRLIDNADSYIFPNDLMYDYLQIKNKPYLVVYGSYLTDNYEMKPVKFDDDKIHLVYAGSIDKLRLAAHIAVDAVNYLDDKYILHILGFGQEEVINELLQQIVDTKGKTKCKIIFEGVKTGLEYYDFVAGCQIGLNTQQLQSDYMTLAFPSKVLSYLSLGLNVVSRDVKAVRESEIADLVCFYNEDSPQAIADAIKNIKILSSDDIKGRIAELDANFKRGIHELILNQEYY